LFSIKALELLISFGNIRVVLALPARTAATATLSTTTLSHGDQVM
jgi:hypothetical protein